MYTKKHEDKTTEMTRSYKLTIEQSNLLVCYILMTTNYRKGEAEAWEQLSKEYPGNETYRSNAEYFKDLSRRLDEIKDILDA